MPTIRAYHRPTTLEDALALVSHADLDATILGGGTVINASPDRHPIDVVDLQAMGLDTLQAEGDRLAIGSMTRLQALVDSSVVPAPLRDLARREAPNTIRNAATVGGTIGAGDPESELLAGLLAYGAIVDIVHSIGSESVALDHLFGGDAEIGLGIITAVSVEVDGDVAVERTGRTPADRPIVTVVGRHAGDQLRLAMTGVAETPVLVELDALDALDPPHDFRGTPGYRRDLARVLADRVMNRLGEHA